MTVQQAAIVDMMVLSSFLERNKKRFHLPARKIEYCKNDQYNNPAAHRLEQHWHY